MEPLWSAIFETRLGFSAVAASATGLRRIVLPTSSRRQASELLAAGLLNSPLQEAAGRLDRIVQDLKAYFLGEGCQPLADLDLRGISPFDARVFRATASIPYGETRSYGWVAKQCGQPGASRAVGQALGRNPFPPVVPCHRVVRADGSLGGFGAGQRMKTLLLRLEGCCERLPFTTFDVR